jgi:hypothetical protein
MTEKSFPHTSIYGFDFEKIRESANCNNSNILDNFNYLNDISFINGNIKLLKTQKVFDEEEGEGNNNSGFSFYCN